MKPVINRRKGAKIVNRKPSAEIRRCLADNLRSYRICREYTQLALAKVSGLPTGYISKVERARKNITLATLEALATALRCRADELLRPQR